MAKRKFTPEEIAGAAEELDSPIDQPVENFVEDAVEIPSESALAVPSNGPSGVTAFGMFQTEGLGQEDVSFPVLRLAQGLTAEVQSGEARPGQWITPNGTVSESITVIPLMFARRREYRNEERNIICSSLDSLTGVGIPGGECAECPLSQWTQGPDGRRIAPPCTFFYSYIVYVIDDDSVAMVNFKRTSMPVGKSINTMFAMNGAGNFGIRLGSNQNKSSRGTYYTPTATKTPISREQSIAARESVA